MMDSNEFKLLLRDCLFKHGAQFASSRRELVIRCPYCGHTSSPGKKHLYINLDENKPYMYNCFKCEEHGIVTDKFLSLLEVNNSVVLEYIRNHNDKLLKDTSGRYNKSKHRDIYIDYENIKVDKSIYKAKMDYINGRIQSDLSLDKMMSMKIVFDFLIFKHKIMRLLRINENDFDILQKQYVGFLSVNNTALILRNILPDNNPRYIIIKLTEYDMFKVYGIPCMIDLNNGMPMVHIAEGQFDILSIYYNLNHCNNGIYMAASGNSYKTVIKYIMSKGIPAMNLHMYFDNDEAGNKAYNRMRIFINNNKPFFMYSNIYAHFNTFKGEKDFGVPMDRIIDKYIKFV